MLCKRKKIVFVFETGSLYVILAGLENTSRVQAKTNKQTKKKKKNNKNLRGSLSAQVTVGGGIKAVVLMERTGQMLDPF